jgi:2-polyprenyl-3-methyl-5-hydroxy-6-metoxy-1,4-benzoquinol methylase
MPQQSSIYKEILEQMPVSNSEVGADVQKHIIMPSIIDLLGSVQEKEILEIYCGAGSMSRRLASLGAKVTAVDSSERLIEIAGEINSREAEHISFAVAESYDLSVIEDSTFDEIVCNMGMMMTRDLGGTIAELARLIKLGGRFIFSVLHPCFNTPDSCWAGNDNDRSQYKTIDNYFSEAWWTSELVQNVRSGRNKIKHRPISRYVNALGARGFTVRRVLEPKPSHDVIALKPHLEVFDRIPVAIIFEAIFPYI